MIMQTQSGSEQSIGGADRKVIHVLCSEDHPVNSWMKQWVAQHKNARLLRAKNQLTRGDFLFLISCSEIIPPELRVAYRHTLVIHASDLPKDRGWSPHIWTVLEGGNIITVSLIECADPVDSGKIWQQERITLNGTETFQEINAHLFDAELRLMDWAIENCDNYQPRDQLGEPTYRRKRTPADSQVNTDQSIADIFDLLRVCDPVRYPAFFEHRGVKYSLTINKIED